MEKHTSKLQQSNEIAIENRQISKFNETQPKTRWKITCFVWILVWRTELGSKCAPNTRPNTMDPSRKSFSAFHAWIFTIYRLVMYDHCRPKLVFHCDFNIRFLFAVCIKIENGKFYRCRQWCKRSPSVFSEWFHSTKIKNDRLAFQVFFFAIQKQFNFIYFAQKFPKFRCENERFRNKISENFQRFEIRRIRTHQMHDPGAAFDR